jgi:acetyl esterase/lipase
MFGPRISKRTLTSALAALAVAGCTPLTAFDTLVPKDPGVELVVKDAAYGPDPRQRIDVYRPRHASAKRMPVIIFFYGGSWSSGSKSGYAFVGRALAARGFLVAIPDYRLVPQVRYPEFVKDGADAVRWVVRSAAQLGGDPDRLVIAGHSAGAYNGAMLAYDSRWLGPDQRRVRGFIGLAGPYDFLPFTGAVTRSAFEGTKDLQSTQPAFFVRKGAPPALLATGSRDRTVFPRNSDALAARLRAVGSPVVRQRYQNVGHVGLLTAIARPFRDRAKVLDGMSLFAREVTGS